MTTCLNCDQPAELRSVVCSFHSGADKPSKLSAGRIFITSMAVSLILGAIIFGCYFGLHLRRG